jgi:YHS domain-containing protein
MMDYMLPKRVMSWKEAWETYAEANGGALFADLARYGITIPKGWEQACKDKDHLSHQAWSTFYNYGAAAAFHTWTPTESEMEWLSAKYPDTFDKHYRPRFEHWAKEAKEGRRFYNGTLPMLCQTCQIPMVFTEPDDPTQIAYRESDYSGMKYHFCSDGCKEIFEHEPEKYVQAWLPVHQIYQGNCFPEADPLRPASIRWPRCSSGTALRWAATTLTLKARPTRKTSRPGVISPPATEPLFRRPIHHDYCFCTPLPLPPEGHRGQVPGPAALHRLGSAPDVLRPVVCAHAADPQVWRVPRRFGLRGAHRISPRSTGPRPSGSSPANRGSPTPKNRWQKTASATRT